MKKSINNISQPVFLSLLALTTLFISFSGMAISSEQTKADRINDLVTAYADYGKFNGAVLVADQGKVIYKKGFGLANLEWDIPNQVDTKFRIASITKMFTNLLIMQLAAENKIDLNAPISTYLTDYPKPNADLVTIDHLRTHTSGVKDFTRIPGVRIVQKYHSHKDLIAKFADIELEFTPGGKFAYSNSGYYLLGVIIEKVTGKPYYQVLQERILTPLKMNDSGFDNTRNILKKRASGYMQEWNQSHLVNANHTDMSIPFSAGAIYSTVEDLHLFDQALYTDTLLPKKYFDTLFDPEKGFWEAPLGSSEDKVRVNGHAGRIAGYESKLTRIIPSQSSVILFSNTPSTSLDEMTQAINGILHDKPYDLAKKSTADSLFKIIEQQGISAAQTHYREVKDLNHYDLNEEEMNNVGYQLYGSNQLKLAEAIFKINTEAFPNSFNAFDSYAELLLALGKKPEAIKNYKKSVTLNPDSENGLKMLKELDGK